MVAIFPKTLAGCTGGSKPAKAKAEPEEKELANPPAPRPNDEQQSPPLSFEGGPSKQIRNNYSPASIPGRACIPALLGYHPRTGGIVY